MSTIYVEPSVTSKTIMIGDIPVGLNHPPIVVAELSGNHNQSLDRALEIVDAAASAGVQALKLQTYTAETMTLDIKEGEFFISNPDSLWEGKSLYELYEEAHTPWDWHKPIMARCQQHGMLCFSTPFDNSAVDFLEELNMPAYKVASFENTDLPLIRRVAATGKPVIISTGMATLKEIEDMVQAAIEGGCNDLILLKCTSSYPAAPSESRLKSIPDLRQRFGVEVGISDHTEGTAVPIAAVALGAVMIEKHLTVSRKEGGVDAAFSLEPDEMKNLVNGARSAWEALGRVDYAPTDSEKMNLQFRRSLYVSEDIQPGEVLSDKNVRAIRPGMGLSPKYTPDVMGKKARTEIKRGTPLSWDMFD